jgi:hypothetical protein
VETDSARWLMIANPEAPAETSPFSAVGLFGFVRHDFCCWKCVADYALLKALDPEASSNG